MKKINLSQSKIIIMNNFDVIILDLRNKVDYDKKHLPKAILINPHNIKSEISKLGVNKFSPIIVYCYSGSISPAVCLILEDLGYKNIFDLGYMENY